MFFTIFPAVVLIVVTFLAGNGEPMSQTAYLAGPQNNAGPRDDGFFLGRWLGGAGRLVFTLIALAMLLAATLLATGVAIDLPGLFNSSLVDPDISRDMHQTFGQADWPRLMRAMGTAVSFVLAVISVIILLKVRRRFGPLHMLRALAGPALLLMSIVVLSHSLPGWNELTRTENGWEFLDQYPAPHQESSGSWRDRPGGAGDHRAALARRAHPHPAICRRERGDRAMSNKANYTMPAKRSCGGGLKFVLFVNLIGAGFLIFAWLAREQRSAPPSLYKPMTVYAPPRASFPPAPPLIDAHAVDSAQAADPGESLVADRYPSQAQAVKALAAHLPEAIEQSTSHVDAIRLNLGDYEAGEPIRAAVFRSFGTAKVTSDSASESASDSTNQVGVTLKIAARRDRSPKSPSSGTIEITVAGPSRSQLLSTKYIEQPWAADPLQFAAEHSGQSWFVIRSARVCVSPDEAHRAAIDNAVSSLLPLIAQRAGRHFVPGMGLSRGVLSVTDDLRKSLPIKDRFVQRFDRAYGTVYAESLLIQASPNWLDRIERDQARAAAQHDVRARTTLASAMIVLATILIAYLFLNGITKSYFSGRLRTVAIFLAMAVIAVAGVVIVNA